MRILLLLVACTGSPAPATDAPPSGKADDFSAPAWLRCEVSGSGNGFFDTAQVSCTSQAPTAVSTDIIVNMTPQKGSPSSLELKQPGSATAKFYADSLPIQVSVDVSFVWPLEDSTFPSLLHASGKLDASGSVFTVAEPFTVWTLNVASDRTRFVKLTSYPVPLGALQTSRGETSFSMALQAVAQPDQPATLVVPVPAGKSGLDADVFDGTNHLAVHFDAPGAWHLDDAGAHRGDAPSTAPSPSVAPSPSPSTDPSPSPSSNPSPTCGTDGQAPCSGQTCATGFVYQSWNGQCHACGADLQPACDGQVCNPGFVYQSWNSQCHACGADLQPACDGQVCNPGFVYQSWNSQCHACGADSQPACDGQMCNDGLVYQSSDNTCHTP
jgi:hypothetical protein